MPARTVSAETFESRIAFFGTFLGLVTLAEIAMPVKRSVKRTSSLVLAKRFMVECGSRFESISKTNLVIK